MVDRPVLVDLLVHHRLSEGGLILLVVSVPSVAHDVDEDVALEFLAILDGKSDSLVNQLWLIAVYVNDRRHCGLSDICAIQTRAGLGRGGCETDLVVCYDMDHSRCFVGV